MKTHKLITLDVEIAEKLKSVNASKLINELLRDHFQTYRHDPFAADLEKKKKKQRELRELNQKIRARSILFSLGVDQKCIAWLKGNWPNVQEDAWTRYIRSREKKIPLEKVKGVIEKNQWILAQQ